MRRWRGQAPSALVFWRDMLGVGTVINLAASFLALLAAAKGLSAPLALAVHAAPLPYNLFLCLVVWRSTPHSSLRRSVAVAWFAAMVVA